MELLDSPCPHQNVAEIHRPESPDAAAASVAVAPQIASPKPGRHPVFKGIRCRSGKWVSEIREPKKTTRIWLGTYATAEMAAAAYDVATLALKGPEASVNFPHLSSYYPLPASQAAGDIRAAAACAASFSLIKCDGGGCVGVQIQLPTTNEGTNLEELISMENDEIGEGIESRTPLSGYETEALLSPYAPPPEAPFNKVVEAVSEGGIEIPALLFPNETENETGEASPMEEFVDEEELFEMPKLLDEMAEGMMVSPPRMKLATYDEEGVEEEMPESLCVDDNLWSFSVLMQTYN